MVLLPLFHIFHRVGIEKRVNFIFRADPQPQQQQQQQEQAFDVRKPQTQISTTAATSAATATTTIISFATVRFLLGFGHTTHTHIPPPHTHTLIYLHWIRVFGFYCPWLGFYCYYLTSTLPTTSFGFQRRLGIKSKVQMLCGQFGFEVGQQRDAQLLRKVQKADPLANTFVCPYVLRFSLSFSLLSAVVTLRPFACHSPAHKESLSERGCVYPGNTMAERKSNYQWTKPNWVSSRSPKRDF